MRRWWGRALLLLAAVASVPTGTLHAQGSGAGEAVRPDVRVTLTAGADSLVVEAPDGWMVYAADPGAAGLPLEVRWSLDGSPPAVEALWPEPEPYETAVGTARVHGGRTSAPLRWTGPVPEAGLLEVTVRWAACRADLCVPGTGRASMPLGR